MDQTPFVIERKVQYHGIWNTGLQLTDQFIKAIANEYTTKPACPSFITLSSNTFSLIVFTREGAMLRKDQIAFEALREVAVNAFDSKCLMVLYVNNKSKYSVMVCSCQDGKEAVKISLAYKQLKNIRLAKQQKQRNWILRQNSFEKSPQNGMADQNGIDYPDGNFDSETSSLQMSEKEEDSISTRSRTPSGVMNDTFAFLNNEMGGDDLADEDVFDLQMDRVPVTDGDQCEAFHVGLQVNFGESPDSLGSSSVSFQSMKEELTNVARESEGGQSQDISGDEFFKTSPLVGHQNGVFTLEEERINDENGENDDNVDDNTDGNTDENDKDDDGDDDETDGNKDTDTDSCTEATSTLVRTDDPEDYDFRSVATMTSYINGRRYKKRPGSMGSSNVYKDMAAQRKHTPVVQQQPRSNPSPQSSITNGVQMRTRPVHGGRTGNSYQSLYLPRQVVMSTTSVSRPIEQVYHSLRKKRGQARSRRVVVHSQRNSWLPSQ